MISIGKVEIMRHNTKNKSASAKAYIFVGVFFIFLQLVRLSIMNNIGYRTSSISSVILFLLIAVLLVIALIFVPVLLAVRITIVLPHFNADILPNIETVYSFKKIVYKKVKQSSLQVYRC